ncbi:MAG TPA: hypothetical protein ENO21_00145 [Firmicutes bacterium]|nr:hypothetical protein [Bacillota bacterium]
MRSVIVLLLFLLIAAAPAVAAAAEGPSPDNPCACTFWTPASGSGELHSLEITLEANTVVTDKDKYFLKLVDRDGKPVYYIRLTIPEEGKNTVALNFEPPLKASQPYMAVLFSPEKDVAMIYLRVTGDVDGEEHVYFDHGCTGITIGPGGCKYMELW